MGPIAEWYQDQTVLLTGGTGFIGKAVIFKLLQCGVKRIYVLTRARRGQSAHERLAKITNEEMMDTVRERCSDRLTAIAGDVTQPGLAISIQDVQTIQESVTVVFHIAASVSFENPLKEAIYTNLRATRDLLAIAESIKNLQMFHYVSTEYSNADQMDPKGVQNRVYTRKMDINKLITFVETRSVEEINALEKKIIGASPNTYLFTKHLAESLIEDASQVMPVVISRPAIVFSSRREPYPGWMDNMSSPIAVLAAAGRGVMRVHVGAKHATKSYIPVDTTVNCILTSTWRNATHHLEEKPLVYNMDSIAITSAELRYSGFRAMHKEVMHDVIWYPRLYIFNNRNVYLFFFFLLHLISGVFLDTLLRITGKKPILLKIYRKMYQAEISLYPIMNTSDNFDVRTYKMLKESIPEEERETFSLDVPATKAEFLEIVINSSTGWKKMTGETVSEKLSAEDRKKYNRLYWVDKAFVFVCIAILSSTISSNIWYLTPFVFIFEYYSQKLFEGECPFMD